jgi:DNA-binding NtrC family response regulator
MNPIRLLVIEDSMSDAMLVDAMLASNRSAYAITLANRLSDALNFLAQKEFDVILTDLGLPDSQGLATLEELYKHAPHLPIVVQTRDDDIETALAAIKMGAQDYLPKSRLDDFALARTIHYAIERQRLTRQLHEALENVKTLSGLLPICASCKKVRDDKGYWSQIEIYVSKHTDASFSHGLCPECGEKFLKDGGIIRPANKEKK